MAVINETYDSSISAYATANYAITEGDTFNGAVGGADHNDGVNIQGLVPGTTYTLTVTVQDIAGFTGIVLVNHSDFHSAGYHFTDGAVHSDAPHNRHFLSASDPAVDGNTITFNFTPVSATSFAVHIQNVNAEETYSVSFAEAVLGPVITENADTVTGDNTGETFEMLGGNDTVDGAGGNDTLNGDAGDDSLTGGAGFDTFIVEPNEGSDIITDFTSGEDLIDLQAFGFSAIEDMQITDTPAGAVIDLGNGNTLTLEGVLSGDLDSSDFVLVDNIVTGGSGSDKVQGKSGVDIMTGHGGDDHYYGNDGDDHLIGGAGKDKLDGGAGNDILEGGADNDLLQGRDGNDTLDGGDKNDRLYGDAGQDVLIGGNGNDKLFGGADADVLTGGKGKDVMSGGSGADVFVFGAGSHKDIITDFEDGVDVMDFSGDASVTSLSDLAITQTGSDVVINHGGNDQITLKNMDIADIDATDFVF